MSNADINEELELSEASGEEDACNNTRLNSSQLTQKQSSGTYSVSCLNAHKHHLILIQLEVAICAGQAMGKNGFGQNWCLVWSKWFGQNWYFV